MIQVKEATGPVLEIEVQGKLLHDDYAKAIPLLEQAIKEHGTLRCVVEIHDLDGFEPRAMIDETKFDLKHWRDIERCAVVCPRGWIEWTSKLWGVLMPKTKIKVFEPGHEAEACAWAGEGLDD